MKQYKYIYYGEITMLHNRYFQTYQALHPE